MRKNKINLRVLIIVLITLIGMLLYINTTKVEEKKKITISAAASLIVVLEDIKDEFSLKNYDFDVVYNFGGSGSLERQIENGAKVDVFISAANKYMDILEEKNMIRNGTRIKLLSNNLVLVSQNKSLTYSKLNDLESINVKNIAIGEPNSVPAGRYTKQVLTNKGVFELLKPKFIYAKDVREVLTWVETGNVDVGFVYETDATSSKNVHIIDDSFENLHDQIDYPIGIIEESNNFEQAKIFIEFLNSDIGKEIFKKHGFNQY